MTRWSSATSASRTGKRSHHEQQGAPRPGHKVGDGAGAGMKWTLDSRNLMRKRMARIWVEGISAVEFFRERALERMSGGADGWG
jgi:hypothetical protein